MLWEQSNEEMFKQFGKALYEMILLNAAERENVITWN